MLMFPAPPPAPFAVSTTTFSGPVAGEHEPLLGGPRRCIAGVLPVWRRTLFRRGHVPRLLCYYVPAIETRNKWRGRKPAGVILPRHASSQSR